MPPTPDEVRTALAAVESSPQLSNSRSRTLLNFLVVECIAGRGDRLKAYSIATLHFGRDEKFDPQSDSIVRVEASKLRRLLELYYLAEGAGSKVEIKLPRGSYQPQFLYREPAVANPVVVENSAQTVLAEPSAPRSPTLRVKLKRSYYWLAAVLLVGVVLAVHLFWPRSAQSTRFGPAIIVGRFDALPAAGTGRNSDLRKELTDALSRFGRYQVFETETARAGAYYELTGRYASPSKVTISVVYRPVGEIVWSRNIDLTASDRDIESIVTPVASQYGAIFSHERRMLAVAPDSDGEACLIRTLDRLRAGEPYPDPGCLDEVVAVRPGSLVAQSVLGRVHAARFLTSGAAPDLARARDASQRGEELGPLNERTRLASLEARFLSDRRAPDKAALGAILQQNPYNADTLARIGRLLVLTGQYEEGSEFLKHAGEFLPLSEIDWAMMFVADWVRGRSSALSAAAHFQTNTSPLVAMMAIVAALEVGDRPQAQQIAQDLARRVPGIAARPGEYLERWGFEQPVRAMVASRLQMVSLSPPP